MDNIDDKYIADAKIKPKAHVIEVSESGPWAFFKGAVSAAAIFLVLGAIFVWTLVGKDIINAYHGKDTTNEMTTTNNVIVPPVADTTTFPIAATTPDGFTTQTPITTTAPITTTPPPVTDITTTVPITTTQPPVTTTTPVTTTPPVTPTPIVLGYNNITVNVADSSVLESQNAHKYTDTKAEYINQYLVFTAQKTVTDVMFFTIEEDASGYKVGEILFTLDKLTPDKPLVIATYLNDATSNRGFSFVLGSGTVFSIGLSASMKGDPSEPIEVENFNSFYIYSAFEENEIIALYKENGCADDLLPSGIQGKVSKNELDKIKTFFIDLTTLRFIPNYYDSSDYFTPDDIDLHGVIMASFAPRLSEVSDEEQRLLPESFIAETHKLTTAQLKELYKKYLGIDFDPAIHAEGIVYLEAYDSYYSWGGGVEGPFRYFENFCAWKMENGNFIVLLEDENGGEYFATLKPTSDDFIIRQAFNTQLGHDPI